ncbi:hypothetical protein VNI00_009027 [Paramarasmius palmivorus]|uniref:Fungal-type protein kinase domain-containing protein n=1 Tax=Paramarasmius palmivorus TaxID=297713 RepID=A0AAW0CS36_9AGAR
MSEPLPSQINTPTKRTSASSVFPYTSMHVVRDKRMTVIGRDMDHKFVGPMDPLTFLDKFLPSARTTRNKETRTRNWSNAVGKLKNVGSGEGISSEKHMYEPLITTLAEFCPSIQLVNTSNDADNINWAHQPGLIKPDISAYTKESGINRNDITRTEFWMELKWAETDDGFDDREGKPLEKDTDSARDTRDQLSTYAGAQLISQFRTHAFSVQLTRNHARLIRWDREGAVVTKKFCYHKEAHLIDFVWRYDRATHETRGHDPSVTEVRDVERARKVREALGMDKEARVWKFTVTDDEGGKEVFTGGKMEFRGVASPSGRCTRGFFVLDSQDQIRYFKETWRILSDNLEPEGKVYGRLKKAGVAHIPDVVISGDAKGAWQETQTRHYTTDANKDVQLRSHQHYFIVFAQIGTPIKDFKNSLQLVQGIAHAIEAHRDAYEKAGVLHRDVSVGNILITDKGEGLLIDWEFSKPLESKSPRTVERTGTWQFMSARLLYHKPGEVDHVLSDDLESFYHVLCWLVLMHGRHGLPVKTVEYEIARIYDDWTGVQKDDKNPRSGGGKGNNFAFSFMANRAKLEEGPLAELVYDLEEAFGIPYKQAKKRRLDTKASSQHKEIQEALDRADRERIETSNWILERFNEALEEKEKLVEQTRDPERSPKFPQLADATDPEKNRKRKKTYSEFEAEDLEEADDEDDDEEYAEPPLQKRRTKV